MLSNRPGPPLTWHLRYRYPCVDFHGKSQRIAVGTHEGAAIVYDVKTATRLYVLESHGRAITAVSWSPDGHRLVTTSLDESRIVAWRVSGGLFGMFMPGAPPRAGSSAQASPFKSYDFHVGDECRSILISPRGSCQRADSVLILKLS